MLSAGFTLPVGKSETLTWHFPRPNRLRLRCGEVLGSLVARLSRNVPLPGVPRAVEKLDQAAVDEICARHERMCAARPGGIRANFAWKDLSDTDLRGRNLTDADLTGAILKGCLLQGARLEHAILDGCDLNGAHLSGALLKRADLRSANLEPGQPGGG